MKSEDYISIKRDNKEIKIHHNGNGFTKKEIKIIINLNESVFNYMMSHTSKQTKKMWGIQEKHYNEKYFIDDLITIIEGVIQ